jgi:hypothetical protein
LNALNGLSSNFIQSTRNYGDIIHLVEQMTDRTQMGDAIQKLIESTVKFRESVVNALNTGLSGWDYVSLISYWNFFEVAKLWIKHMKRETTSYHMYLKVCHVDIFRFFVTTSRLVSIFSLKFLS